MPYQDLRIPFSNNKYFAHINQNCIKMHETKGYQNKTEYLQQSQREISLDGRLQLNLDIQIQL